MRLEEFLSQAEIQLEAQLKEAIAVFQNLPGNRLLKPASNMGWSIAECIAHLNTYSEYYLPRIEEALMKAPPLEDAAFFKHSLLGRYFINSMDPDRNNKKFKALKRHRPSEINNPTGVVSDFIQHLEKMLGLLKQARTRNIRKKSVKTSISPWIRISPGDALQFLLTHNKRHLDQAKRNLING